MNTTTRIPKLFLTAQTVNPPRFPLHVPNESIADKHPINIQIFCRKLRFRCQRILCIIFGVQDQVRYTVSWQHWPFALYRQISHLPAPPPNRLFVISQILSVFQGLSLSFRRAGRREPWERGWTFSFVYFQVFLSFIHDPARMNTLKASCSVRNDYGVAYTHCKLYHQAFYRRLYDRLVSLLHSDCFLLFFLLFPSPSDF